MASFLYMVGISKLFCLFSVGFNSTFYGAFYFMNGAIKVERDTLGFD